MATSAPDCRRLGLSRAQAAALTGFTGRAAAALAHLREAWTVADPDNRRAVEAAIRALLAAHSFRDRRDDLALAILIHGLDQGQAAQLAAAAGLV